MTRLMSRRSNGGGGLVVVLLLEIRLGELHSLVDKFVSSSYLDYFFSGISKKKSDALFPALAEF